MKSLKIKRIYDEPAQDDGIRIFVDRLWARGEKKDDAHLDYWLKNIAPTKDLRKWFNHEQEKFKEFSEKYRDELKYHTDDIKKITDFLKTDNVTLIYGAKSPTINNAVVLRDYILDFIKKNT